MSHLHPFGDSNKALRYQNAQTGTRGVLCKKVFLEILQKSQKNTCARASFLINLQPKACIIIIKETPTHVFFCAFCEISINTLFTEHLWKTASKNAIFKRNQQQLPVNDYYKKLPKVSILHGDYLTLQKFINFWLVKFPITDYYYLHNLLHLNRQ